MWLLAVTVSLSLQLAEVHVVTKNQHNCGSNHYRKERPLVINCTLAGYRLIDERKNG
jgi:hypothetical protein